jgi:hypothetical protein
MTTHTQFRSKAYKSSLRARTLRGRAVREGNGSENRDPDRDRNRNRKWPFDRLRLRSRASTVLHKGGYPYRFECSLALRCERKYAWAEGGMTVCPRETSAFFNGESTRMIGDHGTQTTRPRATRLFRALAMALRCRFPQRLVRISRVGHTPAVSCLRGGSLRFVYVHREDAFL